MIDTVNGATSSAIIYSIAETAKANNLKPYDYFEYLLTEIPNIFGCRGYYVDTVASCIIQSVESK